MLALQAFHMLEIRLTSNGKPGRLQPTDTELNSVQRHDFLSGRFQVINES